MTARVYLWDNRQHHPRYHPRMYRLPSNIHRKRGGLNSREGRDLSKHTPHPCPTISHTHILRINTMVPLTVLDTSHNLLSSTGRPPCSNLGRRDQRQLIAPLRNNLVETSAFNRKPIRTIKLCINKGATMITSRIRITHSINTNIRIALG